MAITAIDEATSQQDLIDILGSLLTDITAIATKLDADAVVTDTDYAAGITTTAS